MGSRPGICHQVAREEFIEIGDFIQATDSHTCMGGASNALTYGVGATEYASLIYSGFTFVKVPESIRFDLFGTLMDGCTAKDVILYILSDHAREELTLNRSMEFGGEGLLSLSIDERATLCNMATECSGRTGICEPDDALYEWMEKSQGMDRSRMIEMAVVPDSGAKYDGGVHVNRPLKNRPYGRPPRQPRRRSTVRPDQWRKYFRHRAGRLSTSRMAARVPQVKRTMWRTMQWSATAAEKSRLGRKGRR